MGKFSFFLKHNFDIILLIRCINHQIETHVLKDLTLYKKLDENVKDPSNITTECESLSIPLKSINSSLCDKITKNTRYINGLTIIRKSDEECLNYKYWVYYQIWKFHKSNKDTIKLDDVIDDFLNIQNAVNKGPAKKICEFDFTSKNKGEELEEKLEKKILRDYIKNYGNIKKDVTNNVKSDMYFKYLTYISKIFDIHKKKCENFWDFFPKGCNEYFVISTNPFKPKDLLDILPKPKAEVSVTKPEGSAVNGHAQVPGGPPGSVAGPVENLKGPKVDESHDAKLKSPKVDERTGQDTSKALAGQNEAPGQQPSRTAATVAGGEREDHKGPAQASRSTSLWSDTFNILGKVFSGSSKRVDSSVGKEQNLAGASATPGKEKPLADLEPSAKAAGAAKVKPKPVDLPPKPAESPPTPAKSAAASSYVASVLDARVLTPGDKVDISEAKVTCLNGTIGDSSTCASASKETEDAQSLEVSYPSISSETYSLGEPVNSLPIMEEENYNIFTSNPKHTMIMGAIIFGAIYVFYLYYNVNTIFICKYGKYMLLHSSMYVLFKCITIKKVFINMFRVSFVY
ncbi:CYIR protein [Plasmodium cynomolgi strain B]|uniref:CYIR protein n=1 Tax=Plasmodium cynomolgi (strain B) TaxID=1120755 RepID=K6V288_PLACD|nr:CYIR protein [Plasmodium cynomolgi strain B]GAB69360.1 CYIR protein [Plasmodium cynomolgi strain B]